MIDGGSFTATTAGRGTLSVTFPGTDTTDQIGVEVVDLSADSSRLGGISIRAADARDGALPDLAPPGAWLRLRVDAVFDGAVVDATRWATWTIDDPALAEIDEDGLLTVSSRATSGSVEIQASVGSLSERLTLTIIDTCVEAITVTDAVGRSSDGVALNVGAPMRADVEVDWSQPMVGWEPWVREQLAWTVDDPGVLEIDGQGLAVGASEGSTRITATLTAATCTGTAAARMVVDVGTEYRIAATFGHGFVTCYEGEWVELELVHRFDDESTAAGLVADLFATDDASVAAVSHAARPATLSCGQAGTTTIRGDRFGEPVAVDVVVYPTDIDERGPDVVYVRADDGRLYGATTDGDVREISVGLPDDVRVTRMNVIEAGERVVFETTDALGGRGLYAARTRGGPLQPMVPAGLDVTDWRVSPDQGWVFALAGQRTESQMLLATSTFGPPSWRIAPAEPAPGSSERGALASMSFSEDGAWVAYATVNGAGFDLRLANVGGPLRKVFLEGTSQTVMRWLDTSWLAHLAGGTLLVGQPLEGAMVAIDDADAFVVSPVENDPRLAWLAPGPSFLAAHVFDPRIETEPRNLALPTADGDARNLQWGPDGRALYTEVPVEGPLGIYHRIVRHDLEAGTSVSNVPSSDSAGDQELYLSPGGDDAIVTFTDGSAVTLWLTDLPAFDRVFVQSDYDLADAAIAFTWVDDDRFVYASAGNLLLVDRRGFSEADGLFDPPVDLLGVFDIGGFLYLRTATPKLYRLDYDRAWQFDAGGRVLVAEEDVTDVWVVEDDVVVFAYPAVDEQGLRLGVTFIDGDTPTTQQLIGGAAVLFVEGIEPL